MKPRFIFSAVAAMCILMIATLPRLAHIPHTGAVPASAAADIAAPVAAIQEMAAPVQKDEQQATPAVAATLPPIAVVTEPQPAAAAEQPAAIQPEAEQPAAQPTQAPPDPAAAAAVVDPFISAGTAIANGAASAAPSIPLSSEPPELQAFTASVVNGQPDSVVGFYVPDVLALPVLQQPGGDGNYISDQDGTVTQFSKPAQFGVTALLAHNFLSGRLFFQLHQDQELYIIHGDGSLLRYRIRSIQSYQALSPYDAQSQFVDLNTASAPVISHGELFERVYTTANQVVLQTCIEANGEPSWGRLFIIADPV